MTIASAGGDFPKTDNDSSIGLQKERKPKKRARKLVTTPEWLNDDETNTRKRYRRTPKNSKIMDMPVDIFLEVRLGVGSMESGV